MQAGLSAMRASVPEPSRRAPGELYSVLSGMIANDEVQNLEILAVDCHHCIIPRRLAAAICGVHQEGREVSGLGDANYVRYDYRPKFAAGVLLYLEKGSVPTLQGSTVGDLHLVKQVLNLDDRIYCLCFSQFVCLGLRLNLLHENSCLELLGLFLSRHCRMRPNAIHVHLASFFSNFLEASLGEHWTHQHYPHFGEVAHRSCVLCSVF